MTEGIAVRSRLLLPGLAAVLGLALLARLLAQAVLPPWFPEAVAGLVLGLVCRAARPIPDGLLPGIRFAVANVLRLGIVLLGAQLSLDTVFRLGGSSLTLVVTLMISALAMSLIVGRLLGLSRRVSILIGVGTSVCGNTAIVATAPVIGATEQEIGHAVAAITLYGTVAVLAFPLIGGAIGLTDARYGTWVGSGVNDTSQVLAAAAAFSGQALVVATVVKLTRNALMAPLLIGIAMLTRPEGLSPTETLRRAIPIFVLGFLAMTALRSVGLIGDEAASLLYGAARFCVLMALTAVGLSTSLRDVLASGRRPLTLGLVVSATVATASAVLITTGLGPR